MASEHDCPFPVRVNQGDRSASNIEVRVSHDLGDRTLVVVILLAIVIGFCGWRIGEDAAMASMNGQYMRDVAAKLQINTNHTDKVATDLQVLKETQDANRR